MLIRGGFGLPATRAEVLGAASTSSSGRVRAPLGSQTGAVTLDTGAGQPGRHRGADAARGADPPRLRAEPHGEHPAQAALPRWSDGTPPNSGDGGEARFHLG